MSPQNPVSISYRIEVSGWDLAENFFVEKTELDWSEPHGKRVYLRHALREHAVVFVRLIHPTASGHSFPVAYRVENIGPANGSGMRAVSLVQLNPRASRNADGEQRPTPVLEEKPR